MNNSQKKLLWLVCLVAWVGCAPVDAPPAAAPTQGAIEGTEEPTAGDSAGAKQGESSERVAGESSGSQSEESTGSTAPGGLLPVPKDTKVLHVGDSFAGALGIPLGKLFEESGMRSVLKHTDSSYLTDWAWDGNLQKYLWKYNPDLVIVTLGANELEIVKPELREKTVKKIIAMIGDRPCVWVAIPLWAGPKNGLLDVIRAHSAPCIYMDTNALFDTSKMARISDGIHPTTSARETWAKDVFSWLKEHRKPTAQHPWTLE